VIEPARAVYARDVKRIYWSDQRGNVIGPARAIYARDDSPKNDMMGDLLRDRDCPGG
jgi:hypothetical protein